MDKKDNERQEKRSYTEPTLAKREEITEVAQGEEPIITGEAVSQPV